MAKIYDVHSVGKRKTSVARVYMVEGSGKITVNERSLKDYFPRESGQALVMQPLKLLNIVEKFDIVVNVKGGGITGQADAIKLGIGRALVKVDPALRADLKKVGLLTRDDRKVERKKYGKRGARRSFQFSKR